MNRYKSLSVTQRPVGWRNEAYRHSLAAKGISTKTGRVAFYEKLLVKGEIVRVRANPLSRKAILLDEEEFLDDMISNSEKYGIEEDTLKRYKEKQANVKAQLSHIPGSPPKGKVGAAGDIREGLYERYKWTSGRKPDFVKKSLGEKEIETLLPWELKKAKYEDVKRESADERAEQRVLDVMDRKVLALEPDEQEGDILQKDVLVKDIRKSSYSGKERRQSMAYVAGDIPVMGVDAVGTAGAAAVGWVPLAVGAGVIYGGARYGKRQYDKYAKKKKKSYHRVSMATKSELLDQKMKLELDVMNGKITDDEYRKQYSELDRQMRDAK